MVVTIIGILAAIAAPRMSSTSTQATKTAVQATITNVRTAVDCYYAEHDRFPGYDPGTLATSSTDFVRQLTMYSDKHGNTNATKTSTFRYGPYLRPPFATNPMNQLNSVHVKATKGAANPADGSVGWVAVLSDGDFGVSATDAQLDTIGVIDAAVRAKLRVAL